MLLKDRGIPESRIARKLDSIAVLSPERQARDGGTKRPDAESSRIHHVRWRTYQREAISDRTVGSTTGVVCSTFIDCGQECLTTQNDRTLAFVYFVEQMVYRALLTPVAVNWRILVYRTLSRRNMHNILEVHDRSPSGGRP
jgi:hypothetical protein